MQTPRRTARRHTRAILGGVVEIDSAANEFAKLLGPFRQQATPVEPASEFPNWHIIERHAAEIRLDIRPPLSAMAAARTPPVVAWYSHKGGVGRTTAHCATAMHLARAEGRRR